MFPSRKSSRSFPCISGLLSVVCLAALILSMAGAQPALAQDWVLAANPLVNRANHTATRLKDGKVLVAGGSGDSGTLSSCQLYDPATNTWTTVGDLKVPRAGHTATLLDDDTVLVAGGSNASVSQKTSELYDPSAKTWDYTNGELVTARDTHTASRLSGGRVLVAGGRGGFSNEAAKRAEIYNPTTKTWASTGDLKGARYRHTAVVLNGDKVLVSGGMLDSPLKSNETFTEPTWTEIDPLETQRTMHSAVLLTGGRALVAGGLSPHNVIITEVYNPSTTDWTRTGDLGSSRALFTTTLLPSGKVLAAGGQFYYPDFSVGLRNSAELYDPVTDTWGPAGFLNEARFAHTATLLLDGRVLVVGGYGSTGILASAELYGPKRGGGGGALLLLLD
jgi:N-acetylneuraminic acid mutarotase